MPIIYRTGNMFDHDFSNDQGEFKVIMHGCNMQGVMGSGVAKEFKSRYPHAFEKYKQDINLGMSLGGWSIAKTGTHRREIYLISAITQKFYGTDGKQYASYEAIENVMMHVLNHVDVVVMPKIGCGLGGCKWENVEAIINKWLPEGKTVYVYSL